MSHLQESIDQIPRKGRDIESKWTTYIVDVAVRSLVPVEKKGILSG